jgi:hypothetical protein
VDNKFARNKVAKIFRNKRRTLGIWTWEGNAPATAAANIICKTIFILIKI